ncbi:hypothetical protein D9M69_579400 [compost metagenome]
MKFTIGANRACWMSSSENVMACMGTGARFLLTRAPGLGSGASLQTTCHCTPSSARSSVPLNFLRFAATSVPVAPIGAFKVRSIT